MYAPEQEDLIPSNSTGYAALSAWSAPLLKPTHKPTRKPIYQPTLKPIVSLTTPPIQQQQLKSNPKGKPAEGQPTEDAIERAAQGDLTAEGTDTGSLSPDEYLALLPEYQLAWNYCVCMGEEERFCSPEVQQQWAGEFKTLLSRSHRHPSGRLYKKHVENSGWWRSFLKRWKAGKSFPKP
jgi:hypothetical protein